VFSSMTYRRIWTLTTAAIVGGGIAVTVVLLIVMVPKVCALAVACGGLTCLVLRRSTLGSRFAASRPVRLLPSGTSRLACAVLPGASVAVFGWAALAGQAGVTLVLVNVVAGIPLLLANDVGRSMPGEPLRLPPELTGDELWHAWDASSAALQRSTTPAAQLRIIVTRAQYLDALAERDPAGLARRLGVGVPVQDWRMFGGEPPVHP
jgi:hypothetical protein